MNSEQTARALRHVIADLLAGPDLAGAACTTTDPDAWFPEQGDGASSRAAKTICKGGVYHGRRIPPCPVRAACLSRALDAPDVITHWGMWAGYTAPKIRRMRKLRAGLRRAIPPASDQAA
jgi:hypothetical protein